MTRGNADDDPNNLVTARTLRIANALWGEQTYPFSEPFSAQIEESYGAGLQPLDFINAFKYYDRFATRDFDGMITGLHHLGLR